MLGRHTVALEMYKPGMPEQQRRVITNKAFRASGDKYLTQLGNIPDAEVRARVAQRYMSVDKHTAALRVVEKGTVDPYWRRALYNRANAHPERKPELLNMLRRPQDKNLDRAAGVFKRVGNLTDRHPKLMLGAGVIGLGTALGASIYQDVKKVSKGDVRACLINALY